MSKRTVVQRTGEKQVRRAADGRWLPGASPNPAGRPKGTPHRCTREVVEQILDALHERGGLEYLRTLDDRLFVRLLVSVLPRDTTITADVRHETIEDWIARMEATKPDKERLPGPGAAGRASRKE